MKNFCILLFLGISFFGFSQKTESPYLLVNSSKAIIPLKSTKADVQITGTIAHVKLTQVYQNLGSNPIEATYIFPLSTKAAVHNMHMKIGDRSIRAKVYEKKKAKKIYDKAIKQGKRAAKLDQKRPNVFEMKVGNIMQGDEVIIEVFYTEMITPINSEYQFVFPGVVGPRFTGENNSGEQTFNLPYTKKGVDSTFDFDLNVCINSGISLQKVYSNSHEILVRHPDLTSAEIGLSSSNKNPGNRDFILNYALRGDDIQTGLLLYKGQNENFFSFMIEPPKKINTGIIPPREYLFVVDVSGSMMGYPIEVTKSLMKNLLSNLTEKDSFNILLFASSSQVFSPNSISASEKNIDKAYKFLKDGSGVYGGGTYLINALKRAYTLPRKYKETARTMVVITDGYVSVEKDAFQLIENNLDKANVVTFGIGSGVNRFLLEGMARVGKSEAFIATNHTDAFKVAKDFKEYINAPLLTQIALKSNGIELYDIEPKTIPDVFSSRPIMVYGKWKGIPTGQISIQGYQSNGKYTKSLQVANAKLSKDHEALKYLWARKSIQRLNDYKKNFREDIKDEVIELGLAYNLATQYTSFVAVDNEVVNKKGKLQKVKQPLPLPAKVNNSAVGAEAKVEGRSIYKRSFKISIKSSIEKTRKRSIKMWLKGSYSKTIEAYLKVYKRLRIYVNASGEVVRIEKEKNGFWIVDPGMISVFEKLPPHLTINKELVITLTR
ncbi:VIT domain-containing protein [Flavobacteriaceae bacterium S356]|uniref:VIT domain-containing protein n=1 Tax=Asprobacillus argus TaxID=3076534 RepID=A0ABU3LEG1_9FLAO|nr:VIT domain-containing protein [Flavobacteriaceae bacterium S356]